MIERISLKAVSTVTYALIIFLMLMNLVVLAGLPWIIRSIVTVDIGSGYTPIIYSAGLYRYFLVFLYIAGILAFLILNELRKIFRSCLVEDVFVLDNVRRLLDCLAHWGEGWARELTVEDFGAQEGSVRVMEAFDLDIFTRLQGRSLEDFRPRLRHLETGGVRIPYLAPEDLIVLKEGSKREKDQLDVSALRRILGE